jgi:hypothetical protein
MALSRYISDRYEAHDIAGTKYVFNVIGPLSSKQVIAIIHTNSDLLNVVNSVMGTPIILSEVEMRLIGLNGGVLHNHNLVCSTQSIPSAVEKVMGLYVHAS